MRVAIESDRSLRSDALRVSDDYEMGTDLIAIALLGFLAGGAIVVIDTLVLRRIRRQKESAEPRDQR